MRVIINNGAEVFDIPYGTTTLELGKGSNGRAFLRCNARATSSIYDFDSLEDGEKVMFSMALADKNKQAYFYLSKGRRDNVLL